MSPATIPACCETQEGRDELRERIHAKLSEVLRRERWTIEELEFGSALVTGLNELDEIEPFPPCRCEPADSAIREMLDRLRERRRELEQEDPADLAGMDVLFALVRGVGAIATYSRARR